MIEVTAMINKCQHNYIVFVAVLTSVKYECNI